MVTVEASRKVQDNTRFDGRNLHDSLVSVLAVVFVQGALVSRTAYSERARQIARQGFTVIVPDRFSAFVPGSPPLLFTTFTDILDGTRVLVTVEGPTTSG